MNALKLQKYFLFFYFLFCNHLRINTKKYLIRSKLSHTSYCNPPRAELIKFHTTSTKTSHNWTRHNHLLKNTSHRCWPPTYEYWLVPHLQRGRLMCWHVDKESQIDATAWRMKWATLSRLSYSLDCLVYELSPNSIQTINQQKTPIPFIRFQK